MKFKGGFGCFFYTFIIFSSIIFLWILAGFIDSVFFNGNAGFLAFHTKLGDKLNIYTTIFISGFCMLLLFFGLRSSLQFQPDYESSDYEPKGVDKAKTERPENRGTFMEAAASFAKSDPAFNQLFQRYVSYLGYKSGSSDYKLNQAIDNYNGGGGSMIAIIAYPAFLIIPIILVQAMVMVRIRNTTGLQMEVAFSAASQSDPEIHQAVVVVSVLIALLVIFRFLKRLGVDVFGFVWSKRPGVKDGEAATKYRNFFDQKIQFKLIPVRRMIYKGVMICAYIPFVSGILLKDTLLFNSGAIFIGLGILLLMFDNGKAESFMVSEKGWVRFIPLWGRAIDFSLADCEGVIVRYQSQKSKSVRYSSGSAMARDFGNNIIKSILGRPNLIPQAILFFRKDQEPIILSLRFLAIGNNNWIDSHEVEFYFAFLLKKYGFQFEVPENKELAGDWKAENPKQNSNT